MKQRNYEYVGAGMFGINHAGIGIYIRYRTNPNEIRLIEQGSRHMVIRCPDRDLYIVGDRQFAQGIQIPFDYDEFVNVSPFWPATGSKTGITNYMTNYTQAIGKEQFSPKLRVGGRHPEHDQVIYADSGGYQIQMERFDYISPELLIEWYNENVDIGMVLDFPPKGMNWPGLIKHMAEAQSAATDVLLAKKRPDLELMNVLHGSDFEDMKLFRSIVERDEIDKMAIGGSYFASGILQSIDHVCRIIATGRSYSHYHMLGVSNIRQLYLLMRMASKGVASYITSDSSTYLQEALNKGYFVWPTVDSPPRYYKIGDRNNRPNSSRILPCSCPVCSAVKYSDVFSVFSGNVLGFLAMYHNLFAFTSLTKTMYDIISEASANDLKSLLRSQLSTRSNGRDEVLSGIDYVDEVAANGVDSASRRFMYFLGGQADEGMSRAKTIFNIGSRDTEDQDGIHMIAEDDPRRIRMERILNSYTGVREVEPKKTVKVKKKERIRKNTGHAKESAGSIRVPGKKRLKQKTEQQKAALKLKKGSK